MITLVDRQSLRLSWLKVPDLVANPLLSQGDGERRPTSLPPLPRHCCAITIASPPHQPPCRDAQGGERGPESRHPATPRWLPINNGGWDPAGGPCGTPVCAVRYFRYLVPGQCLAPPAPSSAANVPRVGPSSQSAIAPCSSSSLCAVPPLPASPRVDTSFQAALSLVGPIIGRAPDAAFHASQFFHFQAVAKRGRHGVRARRAAWRVASLNSGHYPAMRQLRPAHDRCEGQTHSLPLPGPFPVAVRFQGS